MFGYYDDFGYGRGMGRGRGMGFGNGRGRGFGQGCGFGYGMRRGLGGFDSGLFGESDTERLKLYRDQLEVLKKDLDAELKYIDDRIQSLGK